MKKSVFALSLSLLVGLLATSGHAQLVVAKQGEQLPALALNYLGKQPELSGKPLLVEFWATWCPPCRKSIPHLNEIYSKYKAQGLQIVESRTRTRQRLRNFKNRFRWT